MTPLLQLRTLSAFALIVVCSWVVGRVVARRLKRPEDDALAQGVWECAIGLIVCGTALAALGLVGLLYRPLLLGLTLAGVATGIAMVFRRRDMASAINASESCELNAPTTPAWFRGLLCGLVVTTAASSLASALAPPTAGDALCYHLELPKRFLQEHRIAQLPDNDNVTYPLLAEMWFLWGLALDGPTAAQLLCWWCGLLTAGAAYVPALPIVGRTWAMSAAAVVLLTPGINVQMTAPLNDSAVALFAALAVAAWLRSETLLPRDAALVGLMLGAAAAVKFTGLLFAGCLVAVIVVQLWRRGGDRRTIFAAGAVGLLLAAVVAGPWYCRAAWYRGDPVYPFLSAAANESGPATFPESKAPLGRTPTALLTAPWHLTMSPERFGGRGHQLGPLLLMFLPCCLLLPSSSRLRAIAIIGVLYGAACLLLRQNLRFLLPLVPLFAVAVVAVWSRLGDWPIAPRRVVWSAIAAVLLFSAAVAVHRSRSHLAVAIGAESSADYLVRTEPSFAAAQWANENLAADAHILSQEQRAFYFDARLTRENIFRRRVPYDRPADPASIVNLNDRLRVQGFTHLLLAEIEGSNFAAYDATLSKLADAESVADPLRAPIPLQEWRTRDGEGIARRYRLMELR